MTSLKELKDQADQLYRKIGQIDRRNITINYMRKLLHAQNRAFNRCLRRQKMLLNNCGLLR